MKSASTAVRTVGLVAAGQITKSLLTRVPGLPESLGPVKSTSLRTASRIVNVLRAGYPVDSLDSFSNCLTTLLYVPDSMVSGQVSTLAAQPVSWKGRSVLLLATDPDSSRLGPLEALGAATASASPVPGFEDRFYVVEGTRLAIRHARVLLEREGIRVFAIGRRGKALYSAGLDFTNGLFRPLVAATMEALENSGMAQHHAAAVAEQLFQRSLRQYLKSGRRVFSTLAGGNRDLIRQRVKALAAANPALAVYYCENAEQALEFFDCDATWVTDLRRSLKPSGAAV